MDSKKWQLTAITLLAADIEAEAAEAAAEAELGNMEEELAMQAV